jgi:xylulokinase
MAETGLLLDRRTGKPRTPFIPYFEAAASSQGERLAENADPDRFRKTGIWPTFKVSLAKILWFREREGIPLNGAVWLSAADYIAYRLTGQLGTDYSLAGRTYAFRIDEKDWDPGHLADFGLSVDLFPPTRPSGYPLGEVSGGSARETGLLDGIPVAVSGHDHVCGAFAVGAVQPGRAIDSMGTAESFLGPAVSSTIGEREYQSGLSFRCHTAHDRLYWMGGFSTSGGSVEWLRSLLADPPLSFAELDALMNETGSEPGRILFFPYLAGSGSPHTDARVRGAFLGLDLSHTRADLVRAVYEGTAYEMEIVRQAAGLANQSGIERFVAAGGGTKHTAWLQIKADVSGCPIEISAASEATLLGAALLAGVGCGVYASQEQALKSAVPKIQRVVNPSADRHRIYQDLYQQYVAYQAPLRKVHAPGSPQAALS